MVVVGTVNCAATRAVLQVFSHLSEDALHHGLAGLLRQHLLQRHGQVTDHNIFRKSGRLRALLFDRVTSAKRFNSIFLSQDRWTSSPRFSFFLYTISTARSKSIELLSAGCTSSHFLPLVLILSQKCPGLIGNFEDTPRVAQLFRYNREK